MGRNKRKLKKLPCRIIDAGVDKNSAEDQPSKTGGSGTVKIPPTDISSRLSFVVIKNSEIESDDDTDDEETIEFDFRPRKTFLSNACLVCSRVSGAEYLCENCNMVSYCTEDHRREDTASHQDLCRVLSKLYHLEKNSRGFIGGGGLKSDSSAEDYRIFRVGLIEAAENSLKRCLQLWEKEIILYPRACFKCHCTDNLQHNLLCCPDCRVVFWCEDHGESHSKWCLQYKIFQKILLAQTTHGNVEPRIPRVYLTAPCLSLNNFDTIMSTVNDNSDSFRSMDIYNYTTLSHLASIPLTTLYGYQESHSDWKTVENLVVHLVGAEFQYEGINLGVWEKLFLHFLPNLKNLDLVITGPELFLPKVPRRFLTKVKICPRCKLGGKKIAVSFAPRTLYHDYVSSSDYKKPDFTCLFNPGLYRKTGFNGQDTWPKTIFELCQTKVPILVTAYTEREIPMDIKRINSVSQIEVILSPRRNPYASLKPDRNFVSDESVPLIYKNYYLSIVKSVG